MSTSYVKNIENTWKSVSERDPKARRSIFHAPDTLPDETVKRIVEHFSFPKELFDRCYVIAQDFNEPNIDQTDMFQGVNIPNNYQSAMYVFTKEFMLIKSLMGMYEYLFSEKPSAKEIRRSHRSIKKNLLKNLSNIQQHLKIGDRYKKSIVLSGFGSGISFLDKNLDALISNLEMNDEFIENYSAYHPVSNIRRQAVYALASSYYLCFGKIPATGAYSQFGKFSAHLFNNMPDDFPDETLAGYIKYSVIEVEKSVNSE